MYQPKTAPAAAEHDFCIEKQNHAGLYMTESKIRSTLDENLTLKVPKARKAKKKKVRAKSALDTYTAETGAKMLAVDSSRWDKPSDLV